jgi:P27 family predicted phage terminase small subunit
MAKRGPKSKAVDLKLLGGERSDRVPKSVTRPKPMTPVCPEHIDQDWRAKEAWDRLVPHLQASGVLAESDADALALYCSTYSRYRQALDEIRTSGVTTTTDMGSLKSNPAVAVAAQAERLMASMLDAFGLTPASRGRIRTDGDKAQDALAAFLERRR